MTGSLQIKKGNYYMVIDSYENGKRKQKWIPTQLPAKGNKRMAERLLLETLSNLENEIHTTIEKGKILFSDVIRSWLVSVKKRVDLVTWQDYDYLANKQVIPFFEEKEIYLHQMNRHVIQSFIDYKYSKGRLDGKGGLSAGTVKHLKNIVNQTLTYAVKEDLIEHNPCEYLDMPKMERYDAKTLNRNQFLSMFDALKNESIFPVIKMASVYGLRRSEVLGIKWDAIDFENDTLTIRRVVSRGTSVIEKDSTKTKSSRRSFRILPDIKAMLLEIKEQQAKNKREFGNEYQDKGYVFTWPNGVVFDPDYITRTFHKLLVKNDLPLIRFHDLRHSNASLLLNSGMSLKDVQAWLGHSDIGTTADIYGHLDMTRKDVIALQINESLLAS